MITDNCMRGPVGPISISEALRPSLLTREQAIKPQWERHRGYHNRNLTACDTKAGGSVNFGSHIGKMLSHRLWEDLVLRMSVTSIEVYPEGAEMNTITRSRAAIVWVDKNDLKTVKNIEWYP
jgi:hypothetical protein